MGISVNFLWVKVKIKHIKFLIWFDLCFNFTAPTVCSHHYLKWNDTVCSILSYQSATGGNNNCTLEWIPLLGRYCDVSLFAEPAGKQRILLWWWKLRVDCCSLALVWHADNAVICQYLSVDSSLPSILLLNVVHYFIFSILLNWWHHLSPHTRHLHLYKWVSPWTMWHPKLRWDSLAERFL